MSRICSSNPQGRTPDRDDESQANHVKQAPSRCYGLAKPRGGDLASSKAGLRHYVKKVEGRADFAARLLHLLNIVPNLAVGQTTEVVARAQNHHVHTSPNFGPVSINLGITRVCDVLRKGLDALSPGGCDVSLTARSVQASAVQEARPVFIPLQIVIDIAEGRVSDKVDSG